MQTPLDHISEIEMHLSMVVALLILEKIFDIEFIHHVYMLLSTTSKCNVNTNTT